MTRPEAGLVPRAGEELERAAAQPVPASGSAREPTPQDLENDIENIRENLGDLVSELDQRRHRLNPMRLVRGNPLVLAVGGALLLGLGAGTVAWRMSRARRERTLGARVDRLRVALGGAVAGAGNNVGRAPIERPGAMVKLLTAAGTAVAAVAARRLAEAAFARARADAAHRRS
jgi:hypothetical protein